MANCCQNVRGVRRLFERNVINSLVYRFYNLFSLCSTDLLLQEHRPDGHPHASWTGAGPGGAAQAVPGGPAAGLHPFPDGGPRGRRGRSPHPRLPLVLVLHASVR